MEVNASVFRHVQTETNNMEQGRAWPLVCTKRSMQQKRTEPATRRTRAVHVNSLAALELALRNRS